MFLVRKLCLGFFSIIRWFCGIVVEVLKRLVVVVVFFISVCMVIVLLLLLMVMKLFGVMLSEYLCCSLGNLDGWV